MISHFHEDHINGLLKLLEQLKKYNKNANCVRYLVLPCFTLLDIAVVATRLAIGRKGLDKILDQKERELIQRFIADPVQYLFEDGGVENIILITSNGNEGANEYPSVYNSNPNEDIITDTLETEDVANSSNSIANDHYLPDFIKKQFGNRRFMIKKSQGALLFVDGKVSWYFMFFNDQSLLDRRALEDFYKEILDMHGINSDLSNIFDAKKRPGLLDTYEKHLPKIYKNVKNHNDTTLVVFHAPAVETTVKTMIFTPCRFFDRMEVKCMDFDIHCPCCAQQSLQHTEKNGTLLLGDINLSRVLVKILATHMLSGNKSAVCLVPHHGSNKNWTNDILKHVAKPCSWVVSSGIHGRYGHPDREVVKKFERNPDHHLLWCNEYTSIHIEMHS